ncbi:MAG: Smr/MutS family protein [Flavobacteriaceae bacterium]|nr:Smr/MutS family protein [Flavobacteriaceae bacterium]
MDFTKGQKVSVVDEAITGEIVLVGKTVITILTEAGFELDFQKNELVIMEDTFLKSNVFSKSDLDEAVSHKESEKPRHKVLKSKKGRYQPVLEVDLHIHKLLPSSRGMAKHDILTYQLSTAKRQLEFAMQKRIQRIVFIHGIGEGVLKLELEYLFKHYENLKFYEADYQKYGLGATEVYVTQKGMN